MQDTQSIEQLEPGQTGQFIVQEDLGAWNVSRTADGALVLESPEIPISPEDRLSSLRGALLENLGGDIPSNTRFCMDDAKVLRLQTPVAAADFENVVLEMAKTYTQVIDTVTHKEMGGEEVLDLDKLLAEPSMGEVDAENQSISILQTLYQALETDLQLRDLLYIDEAGEQGVIELVEDDISIALLPDPQSGGIALLYGAYLLSNGSAEEREMETALWANSILRVGKDLVIGCDEDFTCLYLRHSLSAQECDPESLKEAIAVLLMTGNKLFDLLGGDAAPDQQQKAEFTGSMETMLSRGGMQV